MVPRNLTISRVVRACGDGKSANWLDVEPGEYTVLREYEEHFGTVFVILERVSNRKTLPPLVMSTKLLDLTHFGEYVVEARR